MHSNPSFAGEKEAGRLAMFTGVENSQERVKGDSFVTRNTNAVAYDDHFILNKVKIGFGGEIFSVNVKGNNTKNKRSANLKGIKLAVAPKFEIKIRTLKPFTISPAVGYTFVTSNETYVKGEGIFTNYTNASVRSSSNFRDVYYDFMPKRGHETTLGLSLSRPTFTLAVGFSVMSYTIKYDLTRYYYQDTIKWQESNVPKDQYTENNLSYRFQTFGYTMFLSKTFRMGKAKHFSLMPFLSVSVIDQYFIPITKESTVGYDSSPYLINWGTTISGLYTQYKSFRIGIMLVSDASYGELAFGYQNKRVNILLSTNQYLAGVVLMNDKLNGSLSVNYYLKRKEASL